MQKVLTGYVLRCLHDSYCKGLKLVGVCGTLRGLCKRYCRLSSVGDKEYSLLVRSSLGLFLPSWPHLGFV